MDPVWTLFTRRTFSRLAYWLAVLGYDSSDRAISNRIYLVYFCAFWSVWVVAVFALLGSGVAVIFQQIPGKASPDVVVVTLAGYTLIIWALLLFWQVSGRSPFVFSEEDAYLLCQTPVSRRKVALTWYLQGILATAAPFAAGIIILSFGLVEWRMLDQAMDLRIFRYLQASLRALTLILPIVFGLQAALWGLGALRLHFRDEPVWLRRVFLGIVLALLAGLLLPGLHSILLAPWNLSLRAAFMQGATTTAWLAGLGLGLVYLAAGLGFLSIQTGKLNLGRAAQETSHVAAVGLARSYGQLDLVDSLLSRQRLSNTRPPSPLLGRRFGNPLFWKDLLQSMRGFRLRELANLAWIFGLSLGMFSLSDWSLQMVLAGVWTISIGGLGTRRLRSDLARWWLLRSLPLGPEELLKNEGFLAWGMYTLVSWLAVALSPLPVTLILYAAALLPWLVANAVLGAAGDILRHSKARILMSPSLAEENVPRLNIGGVVRGLAAVLIPFGLLSWSYTQPDQSIWGLAAVPIAIVITIFTTNAVGSAYRGIE